MAARQPLILIVEDEAPLREVLSRLLETQGYRCETAEDGMEGLEKVRSAFQAAEERSARRKAQREAGEEPDPVEPEGYDVIITDISMPRMDGMEFLRQAKPYVDRITPYMILTAFGELDYATQAMRLGACNFLKKNPFDPEQIFDAIERAYEIRQGNLLRSRYSEQLHEELAAKTRELESTYDGTVIGFAAMMEGKDASTMGHLFRVRDYCRILARAVGMPDKQLRNLDLGSMLHDIGKYSIPDAILTKPGPLTDEEWVVMRTHPQLGAGFVEKIPFLAGATDVILCHHERYDGGGYPNGLQGEDIPLGARIFSIVDTFDAIVSKRCYKDAQDPSVALSEVRRCSGTQFDPKIVEVFEKVLPDFIESMGTHEERFREELARLGLGKVVDRGTIRERIGGSAG